MTHVRRATRDHVIPKADGEGLRLRWSLSLPPTEQVKNWKWACEECNGLRAACGHCVGVMACVLAVATSMRLPPGRVLRGWNNGRVTAEALSVHRSRRLT